jgi:hypothetical protein
VIRRCCDSVRQTSAPLAVEGVVLRCRLSLATTAKAKLLQRAPHWSEKQAERALRAAESNYAGDKWGDLSELHEANGAQTLRRLAEEEQAGGREPS